MVHLGVLQAWFQTRNNALVETELLMSPNQQLVCWNSSKCCLLSVPAKSPIANSQFKAYFLINVLYILTCLICIMCIEWAGPL